MKNVKTESKSSDQAAYQAALEGIVLLKNENAIFPLDGDVALFGEGAKGFYDCGTGSAGITTNRTTSLLEELRGIKGDEHVTFEEVTSRTETVLVVGRKQGMEGNDHPPVLQMRCSPPARIHLKLRQLSFLVF